MGKNKQKDYTAKYTRIEKIGEGGNASVYLCNSEENETSKVALKELILRTVIFPEISYK